jgi:hypothetical protein
MNYKNSKLRKIISSKWTNYALLLLWVIILIVDIHRFDIEYFMKDVWGVLLSVVMVVWISYDVFVGRKNA